MEGRNLVLMFDGTWNDRDDWTNVARMFEAVDRVKDDHEINHFQHAGDHDERVQLVKYLKGVGTGWKGMIHRYFGGLFGYGLSDIIKEGYLWLSDNYREGDHIFVFGFSRGAYSARSLVSLVHKCGGVLNLKPGDHARTKRLLKNAYTLYSEFEEKNEAYDQKLKDFGAEYCQEVQVKMLGVWDTVGALGIPESIFKVEPKKNPSWFDRVLKQTLNCLGSVVPDAWTRKHYVRFHGQGLSCIVERAYHALAIDEHRAAFQPTLWESRPSKDQIVEQCWFVGSHCNVGGGIDNDSDPEDQWQLSYEWMQEKAEKAGLRFKWTYKSKGTRWKWLRNIDDSYRNMACGLYARLEDPVDREVMIHTKEKLDKPKLPNNLAEKLHPSVKLRIENDPEYRPKGLRIKGDSDGPNYEGCTYALKHDKKYLTEIPFNALPVETCSCKMFPNKFDHVTTGHANKMHKKNSHGAHYSKLLH